MNSPRMFAPGVGRGVSSGLALAVVVLGVLGALGWAGVSDGQNAGEIVQADRPADAPAEPDVAEVVSLETALQIINYSTDQQERHAALLKAAEQKVELPVHVLVDLATYDESSDIKNLARTMIATDSRIDRKTAESMRNPAVTDPEKRETLDAGSRRKSEQYKQYK